MPGRSHQNYRCLICRSEQKSTPDKMFFAFPKDEFRKQQWLKNIGRFDLLDKHIPRGLKICQEHFQKKMFGPSGRKLTKDSIPHIVKQENEEMT